jgi:hypothetical protein
MSYEAIVARIHTRPHPNADRLQLGTVCGHQVVVGLDTRMVSWACFSLPTANCRMRWSRTILLYSQAAERTKLGLDPSPHMASSATSAASGAVVPRAEVGWVLVSTVVLNGHGQFALGLLKEGQTFTALNGHGGLPQV